MFCKSMAVAGGLCAALTAVAAGLPTATVVSVNQAADRTIEVVYTTGEEPAIITWEVLTNGIPLAAQALWTATGDVNALVTNGTHTIRWRPDEVTDDRTAKFSVDLSSVRLTAWPTNNPPDYVVVELSVTKGSRVSYYPSVENLPGGLLTNPVYRESAIVLRRIHADGVPWVMGTIDASPHTVTLDHDYYLGVFELTQSQHQLILSGISTPSIYYGIGGSIRPTERLTYNQLRGTTGTYNTAPETDTPDPTAGSVLGVLRKLTGLAFEMPTEAEWEFAARAGQTPFAPTTFEGRYCANGGMPSGTTTGSIYGQNGIPNVGPTNASAIVGSYAPNAWGLYDMAGNVEEWCRDWWKEDITADGGVCVENKQTTTGNYDCYRVARGGSLRTDATACLPTQRQKLPPNASMDNFGNFVGYRPYVSLR